MYSRCFIKKKKRNEFLFSETEPATIIHTHTHTHVLGLEGQLLYRPPDEERIIKGLTTNPIQHVC